MSIKDRSVSLDLSNPKRVVLVIDTRTISVSERSACDKIIEALEREHYEVEMITATELNKRNLRNGLNERQSELLQKLMELHVTEFQTITVPRTAESDRSDTIRSNKERMRREGRGINYRR